MFTLTNDFAVQAIQRNDLSQAQFLIERALLLSSRVPEPLKAVLFQNIGCFFYLKREFEKASLYQTHSTQRGQAADCLQQALSLNNRCVLHLKAKEPRAALEHAGKAISLGEDLL